MRGISCRHSVSASPAAFPPYGADAILVAPGGAPAGDCAHAGDDTPNPHPIARTAAICKPKPPMIRRRPLYSREAARAYTNNWVAAAFFFARPLAAMPSIAAFLWAS